MSDEELATETVAAPLNQSGSLCPAVKAADMIGDRWTLLLMREFLMGASRYGELQRALPRISPTVLSKRLKQMEADGLIIKKATAGEKATQYHLTRCGRELAPLINHMSKWGLRWARRRIAEEDLDVGAFVWDFHRSLNTTELPDGEHVFCVHFSDQTQNNRWWMVAEEGLVDLCQEDPGKSVDMFITGPLAGLAEVWMGDRDIIAAVDDDTVMLTGASYLSKTVRTWFPRSRYADVRPRRFVGEAGADE